MHVKRFMYTKVHEIVEKSSCNL